jgi:uncharacterized protein
MDNNNRANPLFGPFGKALVILLVAFVAVKTVGAVKAIPHIGDNPNIPETISVTGKGEVLVKPDIANFSFTVSEEGSAVAVAQDKANKKMEAILEFLKKNAINESDIKTSAYNIYPRYDYRPYGKQTLAAYVVSQTIDVKVRRLEDAGKLLSGIGEFGAIQVSGLTFSVDKEDELVREARNKAIQDAREQANILAESLGVKLGKITAFYETSPYQPRPLYYKDSVSLGSEGAANQSTQVPGGESEITSTVSITYQIR